MIYPSIEVSWISFFLVISLGWRLLLVWFFETLVWIEGGTPDRYREWFRTIKLLLPLTFGHLFRPPIFWTPSTLCWACTYLWFCTWPICNQLALLHWYDASKLDSMVPIKSPAPLYWDWLPAWERVTVWPFFLSNWTWGSPPAVCSDHVSPAWHCVSPRDLHIHCWLSRVHCQNLFLHHTYGSSSSLNGQSKYHLRRALELTFQLRSPLGMPSNTFERT